jgi:hypothetical protein
MNHLRSVPPGAVVARPRAEAARDAYGARLAKRSGLTGPPSPLGGLISAPIGGALPEGVSVKTNAQGARGISVCV